MELLNVLLCKLLRKKLVITIHDVIAFGPKDRMRWMSQIASSLADGIIVHNKFSAGELAKQTNMPPQKVRIIQSGSYIHTIASNITNVDARDELSISSDAEVLLFFGQIKDEKGLDVLLNALPSIVQARPNVVLVIAGRPWKSDFVQYRSIIEKYGMTDFCNLYIRFIEDSELPLFYQAADLVVLPYRRIYQSAVILMAMSYKKPVITSDLESMQEIVTDGTTGYLFPSGDNQALANRITEILSNKEKMSAIACAGHQLMQGKFSWETVGQLTTDFYTKILNEKHLTNIDGRAHESPKSQSKVS